MQLKNNDSIKNIMSPNVISVNLTQKISEIRQLMADEEIHHVPIVSGRKLVGMISSADMMRMSVSSAYGADQRAIDAMLDHEFTIEKAMRTDVVTLKESETVRDAARELRSSTFHSLPIVDDEGNLVGIVTSADLIAYLYAQY